MKANTKKARKQKPTLLDMKTPNPVKMQVKGVGFADDAVYIKEVIRGTKNNPDYMTPVTTIKGKTYKKNILPVPCGFDIETTAVIDYQKGKAVTAHSYMYIWQMVLGDYIILGRKWEDWHKFMFDVETNLGLYEDENGGRQIIVWVANLSYEFHYIAQHEFNGCKILREVFAAKSAQPLSCNFSFTSNPENYGFIFRDALRVGAGSLASLAKNYCVTQKAVGDLDYTKMRNSKTPLTAYEYRYTMNDVIILHEWARYYNEAFLKQFNFAPMTKTALVRKAVQQLYDRAARDDETLNFRTFNLMPSFEEYYNAMTFLFRGGYTHANCLLAGVLHMGVRGMDFTSSYPAVMLQEEYPVSKFMLPWQWGKKYANIKTWDDLKLLGKFCYYATFKFRGVIAKTTHSLESITKTHEYHENRNNPSETVKQCGIIEDNGRILFAREFTVTLNEDDVKMYEMLYDWQDVEITDLHMAERGKLPSYLTDVVKHYYKAKKILKRQKLDGTPEYVFAKEQVNSAYGLTVQKVHFNDILFNDTEFPHMWHELKRNPDQHLADMNQIYIEVLGMDDESKKRRHGKPKIILSPFWGIWITSHARRRIIEAVANMPDDAIYCDTDSIYLLNYVSHETYFTEWNNKIEAMNRELFGEDFDTLGDLGTFDPVLIEGTDESGNMVYSDTYSFKTMGAKRYIKYDEHYNLETTVAGLPKKSLYKTAEKRLKASGAEPTKKAICEYVVDTFNDNMRIDIGEAFKNAHHYNSTYHFDTVTDEFGNSETMEEISSVCLYPIEFNMKLKQFYIDLMNMSRDEINRFGETYEGEGVAHAKR